MRTITIGLIVTLLLAGGLLAQGVLEIQSAGRGLLAALSGDMEKFESGMRDLEAMMARNPNNPEVKVLYGNGLLVRSGEAVKKGDGQGAMKLFQSGIEQMAQAVELAPDNAFVRARRGVVLISTSRAKSFPAPMAKPLIQLAVEDFEKVLEIREKEQSLAQRSAHQRGEVLSGIADGWNRLGNPEKARNYFERITRDLRGTVYEQRAKAWLENKPETKEVDYFACSGCHVE